MAGCITMTLPKRKCGESKEQKVFLVDAPKGMKKHIFSQINFESEIVHHTFEVEKKYFEDADYARNMTISDD